MDPFAEKKCVGTKGKNRRKKKCSLSDDHKAAENVHLEFLYRGMGLDALENDRKSYIPAHKTQEVNAVQTRLIYDEANETKI